MASADAFIAAQKARQQQATDRVEGRAPATPESGSTEGEIPEGAPATEPEGTDPAPQDGEGSDDPVDASTQDTSEGEPTGDPDDGSTETPNADAPEGADTSGDESTASDPGEEGAPTDEENVELDADTLAALVEQYGDKLLDSPQLQEKVTARIESQVEAKLRETTASTESAAQVREYIEQGQQAAKRMGELAEAANEVQAYAASIEDSEITGDAFDPAEFKQNLQNYGAAIVAEVTQRYDTGFSVATQNILGRMPELSEEQQSEVQQIIQTATRMEGDPKQAAASKGWFMKSVLQFLYDAALDIGAEQERTRLVKRGEANKKIANDAAVKAAAARLAKSRGNQAPATREEASAPSPGAPGGAYDSDYYRQLKREGKFAEAQAYVDRFGRGKVIMPT